MHGRKKKDHEITAVLVTGKELARLGRALTEYEVLMQEGPDNLLPPSDPAVLKEYELTVDLRVRIWDQWEEEYVEEDPDDEIMPRHVAKFLQRNYPDLFWELRGRIIAEEDGTAPSSPPSDFN